MNRKFLKPVDGRRPDMDDDAEHFLKEIGMAWDIFD